MESTLRKTVYCDLKDFDYLAKEFDYIQVTEWDNGEGYDFDFGHNKQISLTIGELEAMTVLSKVIDHPNLFEQFKKK